MNASIPRAMRLTAERFQRPPGLAAFIFSLALVFQPAFAFARHPEVFAELGEPRMLGEARYSLLAWPVFDAQLWSQHSAFSWQHPFALSLTYQRDFRGDNLVARSLRGITERTGDPPSDRLAALLHTCFDDVRVGDRFTGVSLDENRARFYLNARQTCEISWPGFRRVFFGIWLDGRGADRDFSSRLIGRNPLAES